MRTVRRLLGTGALTLAGWVPALAGQDVSGTVRDAVTQAPVRGAVVTLLGPGREVLARTVSSSSGAWRASAQCAAVLRVIRIGYTPYEQALTPGPTRNLTVDMVPLGTSLRPVTVNTQPVCPDRRDQREALSLWSSATDGLIAMVVGRAENRQDGSVLQLLYHRVMGNDGRSIVRQRTQHVITDNTSPIRADREPAEFVRDGYVVQRGEVTTYYGPDPLVLLDSSFAETHCLSIRVDGRGHPGEVGVAFTPTRDRDSIPDIAGVLWMKRSPMALTSLDFEYRGVDAAVHDIRAGGNLVFETMSNGVPIIRAWEVRSPKLGYRTSGRAVAVEVNETGGLIADGKLEDGMVITTPLATVTGHVRNARSVDAVAGALILLDSTDHAVRSRPDGRFTLERVLPGPYTIRVRDSTSIMSVRLGSQGEMYPDSTIHQVLTREATRVIDARLDRRFEVDLQLPSRGRVPWCDRSDAADRRFHVTGSVVTEDNQPVPNARVRLAWADTTLGPLVRTSGTRFARQVESTMQTSVDVVADSSGHFVMCGVPAGRALASRVVTAAGTEHAGTARLNLVETDEAGRRRNSSLRTIRLVVGAQARPEGTGVVTPAVRTR